MFTANAWCDLAGDYILETHVIEEFSTFKIPRNFLKIITALLFRVCVFLSNRTDMANTTEGLDTVAQ